MKEPATKTPSKEMSNLPVRLMRKIARSEFGIRPTEYRPPAQGKTQKMQKITPFFWFDGTAEEATNLYVSLFPNAKILSINRMGPDGPVFMTNFEIEGQRYMALNGGPGYPFSQAVSFMIDCVDQEEVDRLWEQLAEGGEIQQCGWLKDKFGVSWQVIPRALGKLMGDPDPAKSGAVMQAMLGMKKIVVADLQAAYDAA
jgi:predicted 3-demethylubiquinone-9 3-methyltransferase (glyoxalase superfamily)